MPSSVSSSPTPVVFNVAACSKEIDSSSLYDVLSCEVNTGTVVLVGGADLRFYLPRLLSSRSPHVTCDRVFLRRQEDYERRRRNGRRSHWHNVIGHTVSFGTKDFGTREAMAGEASICATEASDCANTRPSKWRRSTLRNLLSPGTVSSYRPFSLASTHGLSSAQKWLLESGGPCVLQEPGAWFVAAV